MKKSFLIPAVAVAGGAAACLLRFWQLRTSYEADTGLPIHSAPARLLLIGVLVLLAVVLIGLAQKQPKDPKSTAPFAAYFAAGPQLATIPMTGVLLLAISGVWELAVAVMGGGLTPQTILNALLAILSAACLFPAVAACLRGSREKAPALREEFLLVPAFSLIIRLVFQYRAVSIDPTLSIYVVELLATVFLTMGFYRLSAFGVQAGQTRCFVQQASLAVVLCFATLADGHAISENLFYIGGGLVMLGFLVLRLNAPAVPATPAPESPSAPNNK